MANYVTVGIELFEPFDTAPEFVKGSGSISVNKEIIPDLINHLKAQMHEDYPKIPIQAKESKTGRIYLDVNIWKKDKDAQQNKELRKLATKKFATQDDNLDDIPF